MGQPLARIDEKYEVVAKIKEGGMGEIYKVRHRLLDEVRVVKVLHPELVGDSELSERFAREARAAIRLRHPNIVQIFDFTVDRSGAGLIVMEYIHGRDLKQLIGGPRLPSVPLTLEIAGQSLRALGYLHRNGFVHRDVSPDNLMLSVDVEGRPLVKVIDLGIAKRRGKDPQLTASGIFLGKFRYASPEHFGARGTGGIEARSDLYAFGLVLYELLTGRYPIAGESMSQLIAGHLFQSPTGFDETDPERRVPETLRQIVLKTLSKDPSGRFPSADELIVRLEELRADYPLSDRVLEEARRLALATDGGEESDAPSSPRPKSAGEAAIREPAASPGGEGRQRQRRAVAELERRVLAMIRRREFAAAREELAAARAELASDPTFEPLRRLLARTVAERIEELMQQAGVAIDAERFDDAVEHLGDALDLDPDNAWIARRLERARAEQRRREEEARRRDERAVAAGSYLRQAREAREAGDVLKARLLIARLLELQPDDAEARDLGRALDRQHRAAELSSLRTTPIAAGLMQAFSDIEARRAQGDAVAAWRLLRDAIEEHGENDTFTQLRRRIAEEILSAGEEMPPED